MTDIKAKLRTREERQEICTILRELYYQPNLEAVVDAALDLLDEKDARIERLRAALKAISNVPEDYPLIPLTKVAARVLEADDELSGDKP